MNADLQARKRELLAQDAVYRNALRVELARLQAATAWVPRAVTYARMISPILALAAPIAGWFFGARKTKRGWWGRSKEVAPPKKRNLFGKMLAGYQFARQVKPVWDGFRKSRARY
jgi:hypothetical protein